MSPALTPTAGVCVHILQVKEVAVVGHPEVGAIGLLATDVIQLACLLLPSVVLPKVEGVASGIVPARLGTAQQAADRQVLDGVVAEAPPRDGRRDRSRSGSRLLYWLASRRRPKWSRCT